MGHHREGRWCITGHTSVLSTRPTCVVVGRECGIQVDYYNTWSKNSVQNVRREMKYVVIYNTFFEGELWIVAQSHSFNLYCGGLNL